MHQTAAALALSFMLLSTAAGFAGPVAEPSAGTAPALTPPAVAPLTEADVQKQRDQRVRTPQGTLPAAIAKVQDVGLMRSYPDGQFHAEKPVSRAELAVLLVKAFKLEKRQDANAAAVAPPRDVPANYWAAAEINTALEKGLMSGYREGYFYPEHPVTRAEALAIIGQAYGVHQYDDQVVTDILSRYPDAGQVPDWARKALATSLKNGFSDVPPSAKIRPLKPMTRGDMAFALSQYLDLLDRTEQPTLR